MIPELCNAWARLCSASGLMAEFLNRHQNLVILGDTTILSFTIAALLFGLLVSGTGWFPLLAIVVDSPTTFIILLLSSTVILYADDERYLGVALQYVLAILLLRARKQPGEYTVEAIIWAFALLLLFVVMRQAHYNVPEDVSDLITLVLAWLILQLAGLAGVMLAICLIVFWLVFSVADETVLDVMAELLDQLSQLISPG